MEGSGQKTETSPIEGSPGKAAKSKKLYMVIAVAVVAILLVASMVYVYQSTKHESKGAPADALQVSNLNMTTVSIPLSGISEKATWYEFNVSGSQVRFFVVKDANGTVHAAFDECWMCYAMHMGFRQDEANAANMIENDCNMSFPISQITKEGCTNIGCNPIFLNSVVQGDQVLFSKTELAKQRFTFLRVDETANVKAYNSTHVAIPLGMVSENATWYRYDVSGTLVRFFAMKDADGKVHTAIDACAKCKMAHMGFRMDGGKLVENCCNMAFPAANITAAGCSGMMCHPGFIANEVIGNQVVVSVADLEAAVGLFA